MAKKFRKKAMKVYEYRRGSMKRALDDLMRNFSMSGKVDWGSLKGKLSGKMTSVELQHKAWSSQNLSS